MPTTTAAVAVLLAGLLALPATLAAQTAGITERVSVDSEGAQGNNGSVVATQLHSISADGRFVVFSSGATNLVPGGDANGTLSDVFVHDRLTGTTERVNVDSAGNQSDSSAGEASISADGRVVAFHSTATNLVPGTANGQLHVYVHDRLTGTTERASVDSAGNQGNTNSLEPVLSADGRFVVFRSAASNLVPGDTLWQDVFLHDRLLHTTERVSVGNTGNQANGSSGIGYSISADGRFVAFHSEASNLVDGDTNSRSDIFVRDRTAGTTTRVSVDSAGGQSNSSSQVPFISADGRFVTFLSTATNLVPDPNPGKIQIFVRDQLNATTERVSVDDDGTPGNDDSLGRPSISADGRFVVFPSRATNLVPGDTNLQQDAFIRDRLNDTTERVNVSNAGMQANSLTRNPSISADGRVVVFDSFADNLVAGDTNGFFDVFVRDLAGAPSADLSITKSDSPDPISVGRDLTYAITVANDGPDPATGVTVTDPLPASVAFVSAASSCVYAGSNHTVTCSLGRLENGDTASVDIVVRPTQRGTITNTADVVADEADSDPSNNTASATTTVVTADLSITKTDAPDPIAVGNDLTYTITVANSGPDPASGVTVTDPLPESVAFVSAAASCVHDSSTHTVTCSLGSLASAGAAAVDIVVRALRGGEVTNTASVTGAETDPDTSNNTASATTTVHGPPDTPPACERLEDSPRAKKPPICP